MRDEFSVAALLSGRRCEGHCRRSEEAPISGPRRFQASVAGELLAHIAQWTGCHDPIRCGARGLGAGSPHWRSRTQFRAVSAKESFMENSDERIAAARTDQ